MTVSAGLNSYSPIASFYSSILIFGIFSWLHFYTSKTGAVLLTIFTIIAFFTLPYFLLLDYFIGEEYKPSVLEGGIPLIFGILSIFFVWKAKNIEINKYAKLILVILPFIMAIYVGGYFTIMAFGR